MLQKQFYKEAQQKRLSKAIGLAGARYTPKLNVNVSIASVFDGLGRTAAFYDEIKRPANEILKSLRSIRDEEVSGVATKELENLKERCVLVANLLLKLPHSGVEKIDFRRIGILSGKAQQSVLKYTQLLRDAEDKERKRREQEAVAAEPKKKERIGYPEDEKFRNARHYLYKISAALGSLAEFSRSSTALAANNPRILLNGIAGSGKTHFLCDLAKHRIARGLPTFIFLGEELSSKNPWRTIQRFLNVDAPEKDFIAVLNRYAAAKRTRALVIVDAVNESQIAGVQWSRFNKLKHYKNLGVILSVRSGFEQSELPKTVLDGYVRVEHQGFSSHEWEALTKFFAEYNLPLPEVPILFPEFRIPLFLKLFCESFAGSKEPIKGHYGFTYIFEQYVKRQGMSFLKRLGETASIGESARRIWNGTIKEIALFMGENGTDRLSEKQAVSIVAKQFPSRGKLALGFLEKYWLITKVPRYRNYKVVGFDYRFPYQKFSDHLVVRNLLGKHLNRVAPHQSFKRGTKLNQIISNGWANRGLIEALSIQVPQWLRGRELVYVTPRRFRYQEFAKECFLESLVWRDLSLKNGRPKFIKTKRVLNYLNRCILPYHGGNDKILEAILTVSPLPNHPLNARLLHNHLRKRRMPERDAFWIPFINSRYGDESAVNRLVAWAWDGGDKSKIRNESLELAGITLGWFLASSNRFLRDRTTKALVSMCIGRIPVLIRILEVFVKIDDPYISERLYAAACGCVLHPGNKREDVSRLGLHVYNTVFRRRKPPVHILLRDYARGVVEAAVAQDSALARKIDAKRINPPYGATFPTKVPSLNQLRRKYYPRMKSPKLPEDGGYWAIWHSLMYNNEGGISDFGNYVVNSTARHWCGLRFNSDGSRPKTIKELDADFKSQLNEAQGSTWRLIEEMRHSLEFQRLLASLPAKEQRPKPEQPAGPDFEKATRIQQEREKAFIKTLNRKQRRLYLKGVLPYRENPSGSNDLDYAAIQRLIFQRVVDLGWTPKLFGKYDSSLREMGRDVRKVERIGKKYQWIAFHEILARIADNFVFRGGWDDSYRPYVGPWQLLERDIDPSCPLRNTRADSALSTPWWVRTSYKNWRPSLTHTQWTRVKNDLPDQKRLLEVPAKGGWLVLESFIRWEQSPMPGEEKFERIRRDVWYMVHSYLVRKEQAKDILRWAKKQDFMGRWMPECWDLHGIFLKEFPFSIAYATEHGAPSEKRWATVDDKQRKPTGFEVMRTTEQYSWEGSGFDCSVDEGIRVLLPAREIVSAMELTQSSEPGKFVDKTGEVIAIDPSVLESGPSVLLIKKNPFLRFLKKNGYELMWTLLGEKLLIGTFGGGPGFLGRLEMGGAYRMKTGSRLSGKPYTKVLPPHG